MEKHMTQEQMAGYLGVTAPAVHKWEKGTSYPDITLLPALARLLDTDLNTLLSFKEELSDQEIAMFLNHLSEVSDTDGVEKAYEEAMEKVREYPSCYPLILNIALFLDGAVLMDVKVKEAEQYREECEALYRRALESTDARIQNQARSMLISRYRGRKEYDKAWELLEALPDESPVDKKQVQANLMIDCGKLQEAAKLEEEKLLMAMTEIHSVLMTLMEIAIKEERFEDAEYIADVSRDASKLFDQWEYTSYVAHFQLYSAQKDWVNTLKVLVPMLKSVTKRWDLKKSPLYQHIQTKKVEPEEGSRMKQMLLKMIKEDEDTAFLRERDEFQDAVKEIEDENGES